MIATLQSSSGLAYIASLSPAAWYRYGVGITSAAGAVSQWADSSGNGRALKQAIGGAQPALQADSSILFDGTSDFLKTDAFTLSQPETIYLLGKQVTWTSGDRIFDGNAAGVGFLFQIGSTPAVDLRFGADGPLDTSAWAVGVNAALACVGNGASSVLQINGTTLTGDAGTASSGGFTLGASASGASAFANVQIMEVILFAAAHDAATRAKVIAYLSRVGAI